MIPTPASVLRAIARDPRVDLPRRLTGPLVRYGGGLYREPPVARANVHWHIKGQDSPPSILLPDASDHGAAALFAALGNLPDLRLVVAVDSLDDPGPAATPRFDVFLKDVAAIAGAAHESAITIHGDDPMLLVDVMANRLDGRWGYETHLVDAEDSPAAEAATGRAGRRAVAAFGDLLASSPAWFEGVESLAFSVPLPAPSAHVRAQARSHLVMRRLIAPKRRPEPRRSMPGFIFGDPVAIKIKAPFPRTPRRPNPGTEDTPA